MTWPRPQAASLLLSPPCTPCPYSSPCPGLFTLIPVAGSGSLAAEVACLLQVCGPGLTNLEAPWQGSLRGPWGPVRWAEVGLPAPAGGARVAACSLRKGAEAMGRAVPSASCRPLCPRLRPAQDEAGAAAEEGGWLQVA